MLLLLPLLMILAGLALRLGVSLAYGVRGPEPDNTIYLGAQLLSGLLVGGGLVLWSLLPLAGSVAALAICILLWMLIAFAIVDTVRSARAMHRRTVGKLLAVAMREGQLAQFSDLLAQTQSGWFVGQAATQLAYELHSGQQLYEAVAHHKAALPREAAAYAAIGALASAEPEALDALSQPDDPQLTSAWRWWSDHVSYGLAMMFTMGILVSLFALFILPQFLNLLWDFGLQLPPATQLVLSLGDQKFVWVLLLTGAAIVLLCSFVIGVFYLLDIPVLRGLADWLFRRVHAAEALRMLALAIEHRTELPRALYAISVTHPVRSIRERLSASYQDVASGQAWPDVLMHNRLLSPNEKGLVETAQAVGNIPWALRQIAQRRESQLAARLTFVGHVTHPLLILVISGFVGLMCIALFLPLVKLIEGIS
jgi:type II secretory pathway component PulF